MTAGTDYKLNPPYRGNPHEKVTADQLAAATAKPYNELRRAHVADYQKLFRRTSLDLGGHEARKLPTDQRLARIAEGVAKRINQRAACPRRLRGGYDLGGWQDCNVDPQVHVGQALPDQVGFSSDAGRRMVQAVGQVS